MSRAWTRSAAIRFAARVERALAPLKFHVGIVGSVLHRGRSSKDLDLIVYPHDLSTATWNDDDIKVYMYRAKLVRRLSARMLLQYWAAKSSSDTKYVDVWERPGGQRVDVFWAWRPR